MKLKGPRFRRASFVILGLAIFLQVVDYYWYYLFPVEAYFKESQIRAIKNSWAIEDSLILQREASIKSQRHDLNTINAESLEVLGFSPSVASRIIKYRSSRSGFKALSDLYNIYNMDTTVLNSVSAHLYIKEALKASPPQVLKPKFFDPNRVSREELKAFGLSSSQTNGIIAFRERYRPFQEPNDLMKVYSIDSVFAEALIPWVRISKTELDSSRSFLDSVNLNLADTMALISIKGIGSYTAKAIVDHREALGGYHSLEQLYDLHFVDSAWFANFHHRFYLSGELELLNINDCSLEELRAHPYMSYYLARNIVEFRERIGLFKKLDELMNIELVDAVLFRKLAPYLVVQKPIE